MRMSFLFSLIAVRSASVQKSFNNGWVKLIPTSGRYSNGRSTDVNPVRLFVFRRGKVPLVRVKSAPISYFNPVGARPTSPPLKFSVQVSLAGVSTPMLELKPPGEDRKACCPLRVNVGS